MKEIFWIRGNKERGSEVIKVLENKGGINKEKYTGDNPYLCYYIMDNEIKICHYDVSEEYYPDFQEYQMLKYCGTELKLPNK